MSCESGKCNIKKSLLVPDEADALESEERQLAEPRTKDEVEYGRLWAQYRLQKAYSPEYWAEVRGKTHG